MSDARGAASAPAVVLGLSPTGLGVARSLGRRGVPVYGVDANPSAVGRHSRYCHYHEGLSRCVANGDVRGLVTGLRELARDAEQPPVLFPTTDAFIETLTAVADELESFLRLSTDLGRFGLDFLSKRKFYDLCRRHDVELPLTFFLSSETDLPEAQAGVRYPAILKPVFVHRFRALLGSRKVVRVSSAAELEVAFSELAQVDPNLIVQEVIPGPDDQIWCAICYFGRDGRSRSVFVARKLRQYPPGFGSASLAESRWNSEVAELSDRFLTRVGFRGLCATEFKRDPRDGRFKMIEVNARVPLWVSLAEAAGVDVAYACYSDLVGRGCQTTDQVDGVRWIFLPKDLASAVRDARRGGLGWSEWIASLRGCRADAVWAPDDPGPALSLPIYLASKGVRRLWRRTMRRIAPGS